VLVPNDTAGESDTSPSRCLYAVGTHDPQGGSAILRVTAFLALAIYYFVGVDEGMVSLFGKTMVIHEWVHDSRHFLGFPCH
jgi:hypothetical protein